MPPRNVILVKHRYQSGTTAWEVFTSLKKFIECHPEHSQNKGKIQYHITRYSQYKTDGIRIFKKTLNPELEE